MACFLVGNKCPNAVCSAKRQPPMDPDWVAHELRTTKKFTGKGDVPVVEALYRDYFEGVASTATVLNFSKLQWGGRGSSDAALGCCHAT